MDSKENLRTFFLSWGLWGIIEMSESKASHLPAMSCENKSPVLFPFVFLHCLVKSTDIFWAIH